MAESSAIIFSQLAARADEAERLRRLDVEVEIARNRGTVEWEIWRSMGGRKTDTGIPFAVLSDGGDRFLVPRYTTDALAASWLLTDGIERFGGGGVHGDMEEWAKGGLFIASFYSPDEREMRSTWLPFCEAICAAYLAACEAAKGE